jgi:hypothetical protein
LVHGVVGRDGTGRLVPWRFCLFHGVVGRDGTGRLAPCRFWMLLSVA